MSDYWFLLAYFSLILVLALFLMIYPFRASIKKALFLIPLILAAVFFGYWQWGGWTEWTAYLEQQANHQRLEAMLHTVGGPEELIARLKQQVLLQPKRAEGWYLLGRLYLSQQQWDESTNAFYKAHLLKPKDDKITMNYAQSLWQKQAHVFSPEIRTLCKTVLMHQKNQPDALAMLAMDAFGRHAYQQAIDYWESLLKQAPPQSEDAMAIRKAIAKAHERNTTGMKP